METHTVYVFSFAIVTLLVLETSADSFVCDLNKSYQENKCNICFCTGDRTTGSEFGCTRMFCDDVENNMLKNCDPTVPSPYRNCWCIREVGTVCEIPKRNLMYLHQLQFKL
ncbi:hypothetical protein PPYR_11390 [Photinus pyralis]|uniref:Pacifastin domain-containing protein n=1 Tax=Photinus pyralis TaxID=7054 RepID=A0A1Y1KRP0_PHOPY|nr:uncharacterized protein LOC116177204 [Photinus pyralis]KAB0794551.1 hypothetical protein PPYR_11390 [Photinus pyralis]